MACAKHPGLCENNFTIEDWAQASAERDRVAIPAKAAQEERRKARVASRAVKAVQISNAEQQSSAEQMDLVDNYGEETVAETNDQSELNLAFWSLDKAIRNNKRYHALLPHWEVLVSLVDSDDLVEMGESQHVA